MSVKEEEEEEEEETRRFLSYKGKEIEGERSIGRR